MSIIESSRRKQILLDNNFKFYVASELKSGEVKWRCNKKTCIAKIYTFGEDDARIILRRDGTHNHEAYSIQQIQRQTITTSVKRKAEEDLFQRPSKLFHCVAYKHNTDQITTSDVYAIKKSAYRVRRKVQPQLPKCAEDVFDVIENMDIKTNRSENFLLVTNRFQNFIIFSCNTNLKFMCSSDTIYMDGTFNYCTKFFTQLFTIHVLQNNNYVAVAFCVLKNKNLQSYTSVLSAIKDLCVNEQLIWNPKKIVIDFEKAIHTAVQTIFCESEIVGCRFHLAQAWWRKIQQLGLAKEYKDKNSELGKWLRDTFGMMYLEPHEVGDFFAFELAELQPLDDKIILYADYLVDTYISENSSFPPKVWASMSSTVNRTTNACESFHKHFNENFYDSHPSIFIFIDCLKNVQCETYIKIQSCHIARKCISSVNKQREVRDKVITMYKNGEISRFKFVKMMSYCHNI